MNEAIRKAIRQLAGTDNIDGVSVFEATVLSVDEENFTCEVETIGDNATTKIPDVRISAESNDGFKLVPKVDSTVIVTITKRGVAFVSMVSDVDRIVLLDGSYGGMVKISDLVTKLNNLENKVNDILSAFNAHTHAGVTVGSGSTATTTTPITGSLTPTNVTDIENDLIIHGQ